MRDLIESVPLHYLSFYVLCMGNSRMFLEKLTCPRIP